MYHRLMPILGLFIATLAAAQSAPSAHDPAIYAKSILDAQLHTLPQHEVGEYLTHLSQSQTYDVFQGQNEALAAEADVIDSKRIKVGENATIDLGPGDIFADFFMAEGLYLSIGAVTSLDAYALRVQVDISAMIPGDELYVIDPTAPRAFGPFGTDNGDSVWLPTVTGDTAVLLVRSATDELPHIRATSISHHFKDMDAIVKQVSCNNLVACEISGDLQSVSTGIARYTFVSGFNTFFCSGSLINNPTTPELEPLFLTANHCIGDQDEAGTMDLFFDFRVATCNPAAAPPSLGSLPRSSGKTLLATSNTLDGSLVELNPVPSGSLGRTYVGWTATPLAVANDIVGIHHPAGSHMRISYGDVTNLDASSNGFQRQTRVEWFDGVTEGGSSGSPILLNENGHKIVGMLSNGSVHVCPEEPARNYDYYATFRHFFNENISAFVNGSSAPGPNPNPDPDPDPVPCPAKVTLSDYPQLLNSLRQLRDSGFLQTPLGQQLVEQYYNAAPGLAQIVGSSDAARSAFLLGAGAAATEGE